MNIDDLDPEIAALLSEADSNGSPAPSSAPPADTSFLGADFDFPDDEDSKKPIANSVDLTVTQFKPIEKFFSDTPHKVFDDPNYYKIALSGESDIAKRLHATLTKYLTCTDPKDRTVYRQQLYSIYYEFIKSVAPKLASLTVAKPKKYLVRYGLVLPSLFTPEQKQLFATVIDENISGEPVYYLDEWLHNISTGQMTLSATDEARPTHHGDDKQRLMTLQSKNAGKLQTAENYLKTSINKRGLLEIELKSKIDQICDHPPIGHFPSLGAPYSEAQKRVFNETSEKLRELLKIDKEINTYLNQYQDAAEESQSIEDKISTASVNTSVSNADLMTEIDTVRQMAKMTVGRKGNHFPIFTKDYYHCTPKETGFRENVIEALAWVESIDPGAFVRMHKNNANRIVPYVLLVPTYGEMGFCWEPYDKYNKVTSRGRIAIPMYPKNLKIAVLTACADLRWQVAKEKASYYWMEEGLTGMYYQWFDQQKLKGDVKDYFIRDYILWMTKEAEGVQRLDKEVRGVFWRYMPFPQERKDMLQMRSLVYADLCQKDMNRAMSDGY
ncbi:MAG: hypothetical protein J6Y75_02650 [Spirochaetaceae bacterium]|nr:hypothetical protein [Spirochaetaceae bacterium]